MFISQNTILMVMYEYNILYSLVYYLMFWNEFDASINESFPIYNLPPKGNPQS